MLTAVNSANASSQVLNFDDLENANQIPQVPDGYQGFTWTTAGYYDTDGPYMPHSLPNALFYASDFSAYASPTFTIPSGLLRVQSLYCRRGRGDTLSQNMLMLGKLNGAVSSSVCLWQTNALRTRLTFWPQTLFTETLNCGTCIDCTDPPVFNSFSNLPLVDTM